MRFASIDPGFAKKGGTAIACWNDRDLVGAYFIRTSKPSPGECDPPAIVNMIAIAREVVSVAMLPTSVVIEKPRTYGGRARRGADTQDLMNLSVLVGVLSGVFATKGAAVILVEPKDIPKDVTEARVKAALAPDEHAMIVKAAPASLRHNVYDAVGIGLRALDDR